MWIYHPKFFLSIIDPTAAYSGGGGVGGNTLMVRARYAGDLEAAFGAEVAPHVVRTEGRDYLFRLEVTRQQLGIMLARVAHELDYRNVKGATREVWRHDAYEKCHSVMHREQTRRSKPDALAPKGAARGRMFDHFADYGASMRGVEPSKGRGRR